MRKKVLFGIVFGSAILFSSTFNSNLNTKIMAATVVEETSTTESSKYEILDMPIVSITTPKDTIIDTDKEYVSASIEIIDENGEVDIEQTDISIRTRGNSTLGADKKSYKVKFDKKQNPLDIGDGKGKTWALLGNPYDVSLLRNLTMFRFVDKLTNVSYSPNCKSVEVYLNGEYEGVYLLSELVNVNKNRVNVVEEVDKVEENGYLVEMTQYGKGDTFEVDTALYEVKSDLSEDKSIHEQQMKYISDYVNKCIEVLKDGDRTTVEQYLDVDSLVDVYIANEITKNADAGWDSTYMSKNPDGKLEFGPLWDFDLTLSNTDCVLGIDSYKGFSPYNILNVNGCAHPWLCYAMENQWFREKVQERWNELSTELEDLPNTVIREAEENYNSYLRNFERWDILGKQVYTQPKYITAMTTYSEHYNYLSEWITKRINWLDGKINSCDFINGIFEDYKGGILSPKSNIFDMCTILVLGWGGEQDYKIKDTVGVEVDIKKAGFGMLDVCGFLLEEGQEYELSFDYSATKEVKTEYAVQANHGNYEKYVSDEIVLKPEVQTPTTRFEIGHKEINAAFVVNFMGADFDNTVVTIDNMKLVKVEKKAPIEGKLEVVNDWKTGALCNLTVTNTTDEDFTDGWSYDFTLNREISNLWNAVLTKNDDGSYTVTNPLWKKTLKAGESFTIGFVVSEGGEISLQ